MHFGINKTVDNIIDMGYFWKLMLESVKKFIDNCSVYIISKKGENINPKNKIFITKDPWDKLVADGWELDNVIKNIIGYKWVIDLIDHFSKF